MTAYDPAIVAGLYVTALVCGYMFLSGRRLAREMNDRGSVFDEFMLPTMRTCAVLYGMLAVLCSCIASASILVRVHTGETVTECRSTVEPLLYPSEPRLEIDCNAIFAGGFEG